MNILKHQQYRMQPVHETTNPYKLVQWVGGCLLYFLFILQVSIVDGQLLNLCNDCYQQQLNEGRMT